MLLEISTSLDMSCRMLVTGFEENSKQSLLASCKIIHIAICFYPTQKVVFFPQKYSLEYAFGLWDATSSSLMNYLALSNLILLLLVFNFDSLYYCFTPIYNFIFPHRYTTLKNFVFTKKTTPWVPISINAIFDCQYFESRCIIRILYGQFSEYVLTSLKGFSSLSKIQ